MMLVESNVKWRSKDPIYVLSENASGGKTEFSISGI